MPTPQVQQFAYGPISPIIAFALSFIGAAFGLACVVRARSAPRRLRWRLLLVGAGALGGLGLWLMQLIAVQGFDVPPLEIRFSLPMLALSLAVALAVMATALLLAGPHRPSPWNVLIGGPLLGVGMVAVAYLAVAAIHLNADIAYRPRPVAASILIAVAGATGLLWFSTYAQRAGSIALGALVFAVAACASHYSGMMALQVTPSHGVRPPTGVAIGDLVIPIVAVASLGLLSMLFVGLTMMSEEDSRPRSGAAPVEAARPLWPRGGEDLPVRIDRSGIR
ncbi:MAG TPA: MHYT domain-containing protein [Micromonosporaceae bacterium]